MTLKNDLLVSLDAAAFSQSIGITPDPWQQEVLRAQDRRIILNCCRQSGKSTTTATKALHVAMFRPKSLVLIASPSMRQSQELFRKVQAAYYAMEARPVLIEDNKLSLAFDNGSRIISLPGVADTVRGFSAVTMLICDESAQIADAFFAAVLPMLVVGDGQLILMSTPYGKRGYFFSEWSTGIDWLRIQVTANQCPRITPAQLERQRKSLGDLFYRQEYQCEFCETEDQTFRLDYVEAAFADDVLPLF